MIRLVLVGSVLGLSACFSGSELKIRKAQVLAVGQRYSEAVQIYKEVGALEARQNADSQLAAQAFAEGARIAHYELKNFEEALSLYEKLILVEQGEAERRAARIKTASILFYDLQLFERALTAYSQLLGLRPTPSEEIDWRNKIVRCYYYLGQFEQAKVESGHLLSLQLKGDDLYQARLLQANVLTAAKEFDAAADVLNDMIESFPDKAKADSVHLMLAVAFEEQRQFAKAIEVLEKVKSFDSRKAFIEEKLKSLQARKEMAPGARGPKK